MLRGVLTIFVKELVDTLRDRKTLLFMLMIPTLAMPLILIGVTKLIQAIQRAEEVQTVTLVADEPTREAYIRLAHTWFRESRIGQTLEMMDSPLARAVLREEDRERFADIPADVLNDPQAFVRWAGTVAEMVRANLDTYEVQQSEPLQDLNEAQMREAVEFYRVVVKGVALVQFVDPSVVEQAEGRAPMEQIPEDLRTVPDIYRIAWLINERRVQGVMHIPQSIDVVLANDQTEMPIVIYFDSTIRMSEEARQRVQAVADAAGKRITYRRLADRGLARAFAEPVVVEPGTNLASTSKLVLVLVGSLLPYLVIVFAFLGGIYPAIDLGAGEKERQTLETLLLSPVSRTQIAIGKFLVILVTSLMSALIGLTSLVVSVRLLVPRAILDTLEIGVRPEIGGLLALMALPVAATFAGILLALSIYARSFKEAQNYMAPLQFVLLIPALAPLLPGLEMTWKMACIPLVNVAMLTREFLTGDVNWGYYAMTLASCFTLAALCVAFCVRQFNQEKVLFRS